MSASIASWSSGRPAGRPSTTQVSPGPWDSPAVTTRSGTRGTLRAPRASPALEVDLRPLGAARRVGGRGLGRARLGGVDLVHVELVLGLADGDELGLAGLQAQRVAARRARVAAAVALQLGDVGADHEHRRLAAVLEAGVDEHRVVGGRERVVGLDRALGWRAGDW